MSKLTRYGLKYNGKLLQVENRENPSNDDYCVPILFYLTEWAVDRAPWLVYCREYAEKASKTDSRWYNADYETPMNMFIGRCEVVEVTLEF